MLHTRTPKHSESPRDVGVSGLLRAENEAGTAETQCCTRRWGRPEPTRLYVASQEISIRRTWDQIGQLQFDVVDA